MLSLFVNNEVPLHCINEAAYQYHVSAKLLISVLNVERGKVGLARRNTNGTYDLGPYQINTMWWPTLYAYGIRPQDVLYNPCVNVKVATWILAKAIADSGDLLSGIGNYYSHHLICNQRYTQHVRINFTELSHMLKIGKD